MSERVQGRAREWEVNAKYFWTQHAGLSSLHKEGKQIRKAFCLKNERGYCLTQLCVREMGSRQFSHCLGLLK